jgi:hypothetical protein
MASPLADATFLEKPSACLLVTCDGRGGGARHFRHDHRIQVVYYEYSRTAVLLQRLLPLLAVIGKQGRHGRR